VRDAYKKRVGRQAQLQLANATGDRKAQRDHDHLSIRRSTGGGDQDSVTVGLHPQSAL
jgi:hypothetical protein